MQVVLRLCCHILLNIHWHWWLHGSLWGRLHFIIVQWLQGSLVLWMINQTYFYATHVTACRVGCRWRSKKSTVFLCHLLQCMDLRKQVTHMFLWGHLLMDCIEAWFTWSVWSVDCNWHGLSMASLHTSEIAYYVPFNMYWGNVTSPSLIVVVNLKDFDFWQDVTGNKQNIMVFSTEDHWQYSLWTLPACLMICQKLTSNWHLLSFM